MTALLIVAGTFVLAVLRQRRLDARTSRHPVDSSRDRDLERTAHDLWINASGSPAERTAAARDLMRRHHVA